MVFNRFLLRLLPVEVSCYPSDEEIRRAIKPVIEKYFPVETEKPHKVNVSLSSYYFVVLISNIDIEDSYIESTSYGYIIFLTLSPNNSSSD